MAEENNGAAEATPPQQPIVKVLNQYIRDLSFENVALQNDRMPEGQTSFEVQVALDARKVSENQYEVINKLKVNATIGEEKIFILELDYAGRFSVQNVPNEQLHAFLMIECPRMIFPYLRRVVGDVTRDGGYPPLNLDNIDFLALYRNQMAKMAQAQAEAKEAPIS
ncbi:protein-export chaperone SecB [Rhodobacterales bacterium 52_120_T64]|nr:protein-export chaperone SecB [Rhodobacterales bacterium 52_120_T64]